jgi:hypothetical protein
VFAAACGVGLFVGLFDKKAEAPHKNGTRANDKGKREKSKA